MILPRAWQRRDNGEGKAENAKPDYDQHSYLILAYAGSKKAAEDDGFITRPMPAAGCSASCCRAC
jgi:hypothetical protein